MDIEQITELLEEAMTSELGAEPSDEDWEEIMAAVEADEEVGAEPSLDEYLGAVRRASRGLRLSRLRPRGGGTSLARRPSSSARRGGGRRLLLPGLFRRGGGGGGGGASATRAMMRVFGPFVKEGTDLLRVIKDILRARYGGAPGRAGTQAAARTAAGTLRDIAQAQKSVEQFDEGKSGMKKFWPFEPKTNGIITLSNGREDFELEAQRLAFMQQFVITRKDFAADPLELEQVRATRCKVLLDIGADPVIYQPGVDVEIFGPQADVNTLLAQTGGKVWSAQKFTATIYPVDDLPPTGEIRFGLSARLRSRR